MIGVRRRRILTERSCLQLTLIQNCSLFLNNSHKLISNSTQFKSSQARVSGESWICNWGTFYNCQLVLYYTLRTSIVGVSVWKLETRITTDDTPTVILKTDTLTQDEPYHIRVWSKRRNTRNDLEPGSSVRSIYIYLYENKISSSYSIPLVGWLKTWIISKVKSVPE